jgi:hypothetical protein
MKRKTAATMHRYRFDGTNWVKEKEIEQQQQLTSRPAKKKARKEATTHSSTTTKVLFPPLLTTIKTSLPTFDEEFKKTILHSSISNQILRQCDQCPTRLLEHQWTCYEYRCTEYLENALGKNEVKLENLIVVAKNILEKQFDMGRDEDASEKEKYIYSLIQQNNLTQFVFYYLPQQPIIVGTGDEFDRSLFETASTVALAQLETELLLNNNGDHLGIGLDFNLEELLGSTI